MYKHIIFFCLDIFTLFFSTLKNLINLKKLKGKSILKTNPNKKLLIIANGPSLKKDIERIKLIHNSCDIFALNNFANYEYFREIKPNFYFFFDQMFWSNSVNSKLIENRKTLFSKIRNIDWDMQIICAEAGFFKIRSYFKDNNRIKVIKLKNNSCNLKLENLHKYALTHNLCTPNFGRGVLIPALWYGIFINKKDIEIYGADFSQFKEFEVDQKTNETFTNHTHFYKVIEGQKKRELKYKTQKKEKKVHERLLNISLMFKQMYLLSEIAKIKGLKVVNFSSKSYLDCFPRP